MDLKVLRYSMGEGSTQGLLLLNGQFACYTLEDKLQDHKIAGQTCIPAGRYRIALRNEGNQTLRYAKKFPDMHKGMLHITEVPSFEFIHIHIGNSVTDTDGCLLVGDQVNNNQYGDGRVLNSTNAYQRIYPVIAAAIESGAEVWIEYIDISTIAASNGEQDILAQVSADRLNLRSSPHKSITGVMKQGTLTRITQQENGWNKVQIEGWVASEYLEEL